MYLPACVPHVCPRKTEGVGSFGTAAIDGCGYWEPDLNPLQELGHLSIPWIFERLFLFSVFKICLFMCILECIVTQEVVSHHMGVWK